MLTAPKEPNPIESSKTKSRDISNLTTSAPTAIHFAKGYLEDKDFALVFKRMQEERLQDQKYCAYCLAKNGLMYFKDADGEVRLCMLSSE